MKKNKKYKRRKNFFRREVILQKLAEAGEYTANGLLNAIWGFGAMASAMLLPYHSSYRALRSAAGVSAPTIDLQMKVAFWSLISKLKKEGLVAETKKGKLTITKNGEDYLEEKSQTPSWFKTYKIIRNPNKNKLILVIFDIPEIQRIKRDWLRFQLSNLEFRFLQKSVMFSNNILPKEFIDDLKKYELLPHVHIFSVTKKGTISEFLKRIGERDLAE